MFLPQEKLRFDPSFSVRPQFILCQKSGQESLDAKVRQQIHACVIENFHGGQVANDRRQGHAAVHGRQVDARHVRYVTDDGEAIQW